MADLAQGGRGCEEKGGESKSERAGHAGMRDTRGLHPLLCPEEKLRWQSPSRIDVAVPNRMVSMRIGRGQILVGSS